MGLGTIPFAKFLLFRLMYVKYLMKICERVSMIL